jgi:O-antigen biosynthesis protein
MTPLDLSIIIVTYNSTDDALNTCESYRTAIAADPDHTYEVIVVDNDSVSGTADAIAQHHPWVELIRNPANIGYSCANNIGFRACTGRYLLFSNPDIEVFADTLPILINTMDQAPHVGACTPYLELMESGNLDWGAHRGFPTPWASFTYMTRVAHICRFSQRLSRVFGRYHMMDKDLSAPHEVEAINGGFTFIRREVFEEIDGWDEDYFLFGEDIDLCLRIAERGHRIMFYPQARARHRLGSTTGLKHNSPTTDPHVRDSSYNLFYDSMRLFYDKNYRNRYGPLVRGAVLLSIEMKRKLGRRRIVV